MKYLIHYAWNENSLMYSNHLIFNSETLNYDLTFPNSFIVSNIFMTMI